MLGRFRLLDWLRIYRSPKLGPQKDFLCRCSVSGSSCQIWIPRRVSKTRHCAFLLSLIQLISANNLIFESCLNSRVENDSKCCTSSMTSLICNIDFITKHRVRPTATIFTKFRGVPKFLQKI